MLFFLKTENGEEEEITEKMQTKNKTLKRKQKVQKVKICELFVIVQEALKVVEALRLLCSLELEYLYGYLFCPKISPYIYVLIQDCTFIHFWTKPNYYVKSFVM